MSYLVRWLLFTASNVLIRCSQATHDKEMATRGAKAPGGGPVQNANNDGQRPLATSLNGGRQRSEMKAHNIVNDVAGDDDDKHHLAAELQEQQTNHDEKDWDSIADENENESGRKATELTKDDKRVMKETSTNLKARSGKRGKANSKEVVKANDKEAVKANDKLLPKVSDTDSALDKILQLKSKNKKIAMGEIFKVKFAEFLGEQR